MGAQPTKRRRASSTPDPSPRSATKPSPKRRRAAPFAEAGPRATVRSSEPVAHPSVDENLDPSQAISEVASPYPAPVASSVVGMQSSDLPFLFPAATPPRSERMSELSLRPRTPGSPSGHSPEMNAQTEEDGLDAGSLFWQDDEIVPHYEDDPDDDGEGINGIGFRQTAAEKILSIRRRQDQMRDWKRRQAAEDRAKRGQRRGGGGAEPPALSSPVRRVRFISLDEQVNPSASQ